MVTINSKILIKKLRKYADIRNYTRAGKVAYIGAAGVFLVSVMIPTIQTISELRTYKLSSSVTRLLDAPSGELAKKFTYNAATKTHHFNEAEKSIEASPGVDPAQALQSQVTGTDGAEKTLYSVDMPENIQDGFTYYDNNLKLSFKLIPQNQSGRGVLHEDRLIYKLADGTSAIFTAKSNGIKEDIILDKAPQTDDMIWRYDLDLPKSLEARMLENGGLGIYSADPSLFGNISYGSDSDRDKVMAARETGVKNYLVFDIPAPVIKETNEASHASAKFLLSDDKSTLTISAEGLHGATYPLSVDPTVVVTSTSDFADGNNETSTDINSGQVDRGTVTGGALGTFSDTGLAQLPVARSNFMSTMYNGYIYLISGESASGGQDMINHAKIQDDGTISSWSTDSTTWVPVSVRYGDAVAYNGYIYVTGGLAYGGQTESDRVYSAPLSPIDGTVGSFTLINTFATARYAHKSLAYNNYLYIFGGLKNDPLGDTSYRDVQRAPIYANGMLGAWTTSGVAAMVSQRYTAASVMYNGYIYMLSGRFVNGFGVVTNNASFEFARINDDGTISNWTQSAMGGTFSASAVAYAGYAYIVTGVNYNGNVFTAELTGSGTPGSVTITGNISGGSNVGYAGAFAYKGSVYVLGGSWGSTATNYVYKAAINRAGTPRTFTASANNVGATGRTGAATVAYNGYLYAAGGYNGSTYLNDIQKATIDSVASSSVGVWSSAGSSFTTARAFASATTYGGRIYLSGGHTGSAAIDDLQSIDIDMSNGNVTGSWATQTAPSSARYKHSIVAYNDNLYVIGGDTGSGVLNTVRWGTLNSSGVITDWKDVTGFTTARRGMGVGLYGNRLYIAGGYDGSSMLGDVQYASIANDGTLGAWSGAGNSLSVARSGLGLIVHNGYLYAMGGATGTGEATASNVVEFAPLNNDGSIGAFTAAPSLLTARAYAAFATQNSYITAATGGSTGGTGGTLYNTVELSYVDNGANGVTNTWGTPTTTSFTTARTQHASVAYNGYIYVIGGISGVSPQTSVQVAPITSIGTVTAATWTVGTALPAARYGHEVVVNNGYIYIVGGLDSGGSPTSTLYYAKLNRTDGSIPAWSPSTGFNLPSALTGMRVASYNGKMYVTGGTTNPGTGATTNQVNYATYNSNGSLSGWTSATGFNTARTKHSAFAVNGHLYVAGGLTDSTSPASARNDVQFAKLNSDGSINGSWQYAANLPNAISGTRLVPYNGYVYMIGGRDSGGTIVANTYRSTINSSGNTGRWNTAGTNLPAGRTDYGVAAIQGTLYVTGGSGPSVDNLSTVTASRMTSLSRVGVYSKLIDVGAAVDLQGLAYSGFLVDGPTAIKYTQAPISGIFGQQYNSDELDNLDVSCIAPPVNRYFFVRATLDDSVNASFPDSTQTQKSNVQEIRLLYAPGLRGPTQTRLFQGKYFGDQKLLPYDTCNG